MSFSLQNFEDSARQNGVRYWEAHVFMRELGYETWASFQSVINKAMASCSRLNIDVTDAFISDSVEIDGRTQKTWRLTRFACLLVTMHADGNKPAVAAAKAALAAIADKLIEAQVGHADIGRIETRDDLKSAEISLGGAAKIAGVANNEFAIFKDAGFRGMYNMSLQDLKRSRGLDSKDVPYDFMGLTELAGNLFRVTQTSERLKNLPGAGLRKAVDTAKSVGADVRRLMIQNSGVAPESLPAEENINDVKKKLRSTAKKMMKLDSGKPARKKSSPSK